MTHIHRFMWTDTMNKNIRIEVKKPQQKTKSCFYVIFQNFISDTHQNKPNLQSCSENGIVSYVHLINRIWSFWIVRYFLFPYLIGKVNWPNWVRVLGFCGIRIFFHHSTLNSYRVKSWIYVFLITGWRVWSFYQEKNQNNKTPEESYIAFQRKLN